VKILVKNPNLYSKWECFGQKNLIIYSNFKNYNCVVKNKMISQQQKYWSNIKNVDKKKFLVKNVYFHKTLPGTVFLGVKRSAQNLKLC